MNLMISNESSIVLDSNSFFLNGYTKVGWHDFNKRWVLIGFLMKSILIVSSSFYPAYKSGGPVRSLTNLVSELDKSVKFDILTRDRDMGDESSFENININSWLNKYKSSSVFYLSPDYDFFSNLRKIFSNKKYDLIYLNSFFDYCFSIRVMMLVLFGFIKAEKILIAPRGEVTKGALSLKSFKKRVYIAAFKLLGLRNRVMFQFTSKEEMSDGLLFLGDINYKLAPNMHEVPPPYVEKVKNTNSLRLIFLSRVSPKKNLLTIIESLRLVSSHEIIFNIAGVIDDKAYWSKCLSLIKLLPSNIKVSYLGALNRKRVSIELNKSHLFFLPTLNENYGHAIVEAMVYSNIIMISDQTPWSKVSCHGGFVGGVDDITYYAESIKLIAAMEQFEYNIATKKVYHFCCAILNNNVKKIKQLFY